MTRCLLACCAMLVGCGGADPAPTPSPYVVALLDASMSVEPSPPPVPDWDKTLKALDETNRMLEDCIMPAYGLYAKQGICDMPPSECREDDR